MAPRPTATGWYCTTTCCRRPDDHDRRHHPCCLSILHRRPPIVRPAHGSSSRPSEHRFAVWRWWSAGTRPAKAQAAIAEGPRPNTPTLPVSETLEKLFADRYSTEEVRRCRQPEASALQARARWHFWSWPMFGIASRCGRTGSWRRSLRSSSALCARGNSSLTEAECVAVGGEAFVVGEGQHRRRHACERAGVGSGDCRALEERVGGDTRRHVREARCG